MVSPNPSNPTFTGPSFSSDGSAILSVSLMDDHPHASIDRA